MASVWLQNVNLAQKQLSIFSFDAGVTDFSILQLKEEVSISLVIQLVCERRDRLELFNHVIDLLVCNDAWEVFVPHSIG